jgi:hypothetical protein
MMEYLSILKSSETKRYILGNDKYKIQDSPRKEAERYFRKVANKCMHQSVNT